MQAGRVKCSTLRLCGGGGTVQAAEAQAKRSVDSKFAATTEPIRSYIMVCAGAHRRCSAVRTRRAALWSRPLPPPPPPAQAHVMPTVTEALRTLAVERPQDPLRFLGEHLIKEAIAVSAPPVRRANDVCGSHAVANACLDPATASSAGAQREAQWTDPYAAPAYEQQRQKLVDKQARDEARALAEAQKAEK